MGVPFHSIEAVDGFNEFAFVDRALVGLNLGVAYGAGGGAGLTVVVPVSIPVSAGLPANYGVFCEADGDVTFAISAKTSAGFTVTVSPRTAALTIAAGSTNILIVA